MPVQVTNPTLSVPDNVEALTAPAATTQPGGPPPRQASLEIHLHLADGSVTRLKPEGSEAIQAILARLHPERFFAQQHLIVAEPTAVTLFRWSAVTRVDLITDRDLAWPFPAHVLDWVELTPEEFSDRCRAFPPRTKLHGGAGEIVEAVAEIQFGDGQRLLSLLKLRLSPQLPLDQSMLLHHSLERPALHLRRRGGGMIIVNPTQISRLSVHPGPHASPPDAWQADRLTD